MGRDLKSIACLLAMSTGMGAYNIDPEPSWDFPEGLRPYRAPPKRRKAKPIAVQKRRKANKLARKQRRLP